ncbi:MAG: TRAP transporter small permease [Paracoccaceae bacterium]|nr:TRAP transporter small permease [Paracoccaceae bacterium]
MGVDGFFSSLTKLFSKLNLICAILGAALLFFIAFIICFEVTGRALGGASRLWVIETSEYALLYITFLGAPYLLEKNMHVVLDLVYDSFKHTWRLVFQALNSGIGFLVCAILTIVGIIVVAEQFELGVREVTVMRPHSWWLTAAFPLGAGLMAFQFLEQFVRTLKGKVL